MITHISNTTFANLTDMVYLYVSISLHVLARYLTTFFGISLDKLIIVREAVGQVRIFRKIEQDNDLIHRRIVREIYFKDTTAAVLQRFARL